MTGKLVLSGWVALNQTDQTALVTMKYTMGSGNTVAIAPATCQMRDKRQYSSPTVVLARSRVRCFNWMGTNTNNQIRPEKDSKP